MKVVIINGYGGTGKDTVVDLIEDFATEDNITVTNISTVDLVKDAAKSLGWLGEKSDKSRKFLSDLKKLWIEYSDGPFNYIKNMLTICSTISDIVFIHCREIEEIKKIVEHCVNNDIEIITLLVNREDIQIDTNESDRNVLNYCYDYVINNDETIEELKEYVFDFYTIHLIK